MLRGIDPHGHLTGDDPVEMAVTARAAKRALELRQQEFDYLAEQIATRLARALGGRR